ncbi:MAG: M36 family metallopeptidase, partial [Nitrososphaera sp.]
MRWSKKTGTPASVLGLPIEISQASPQEVARQFLLQHRVMFKMKEGLSDLDVKKVEERLRATHVVFQQSFQDIPVEGAVYAVHMTKDKKIYLANGEYFDDLQVSSLTPAITLTAAIDVAQNDLGATLILRDIPTGELVILPYGPEFRLSWKVTIRAKEPSGEWLYFISAADGSILTGYNSADFAESQGNVYDRHPEVGPVVPRTLTNLLGNGYTLDGTFVRALNEDDVEANEPDNTFLYNPSDTHFDEVMVYYHANRFQDDYLGNLGYPYLNYPGTLVKAEATVHFGTNLNNAEAISPNILHFGDGDGVTYNDFAKEDDVINHEYQHLVTEYITSSGLDAPGNFYDQTDAMDEAFSDYLACSFAGTPLQGEYVRVGPGSERNLDNSFTMSDWDGDPPDAIPADRYHDGGQIFSGALWDLRQQLGQSIADVLAFEGLETLDQAAPVFLDGRDEIIAADYAFYGGAHVNTIESVFDARGITPPLSVFISGPGSIQPGVEGIWTANVSGGISTKSFQWSVRYEGSSNFDNLGIDQEQRLTFFEECTINELKVIVTSGGQTAEDLHTVYVNDGSGQLCKRGAGESETEELA